MNCRGPWPSAFESTSSREKSPGHTARGDGDAPLAAGVLTRHKKSKLSSNYGAALAPQTVYSLWYRLRASGALWHLLVGNLLEGAKPCKWRHPWPPHLALNLGVFHVGFMEGWATQGSAIQAGTWRLQVVLQASGLVRCRSCRQE